VVYEIIREKNINRMEKIIVLDGIMTISDDDRKFVNDLNLSSDYLFKIFKIMAEQVLGIKIAKWHFDCEKCQTRIWLG